MELEMKIRGLMMDPVTNMPIVILKDVSGNSVLPIWVGIYEANAIALEIEKVTTQRPMTHDLIKSLLTGFEHRDQESCSQRAERGHLLRPDLAGTRRRADQRGFASQRRPGSRITPRLPDLRGRHSSEVVQADGERFRQGQQRRAAQVARRPERRGSRPATVVEILERLAAAGIQLLPAVEITTHYIFERDGFVALVERNPEGFGGVGSAGILTGSGFAALIQRGDRSCFVAKGFEQDASASQVVALRSFSTDLKAALGQS